MLVAMVVEVGRWWWLFVMLVVMVVEVGRWWWWFVMLVTMVVEVGGVVVCDVNGDGGGSR